MQNINDEERRKRQLKNALNNMSDEDVLFATDFPEATLVRYALDDLPKNEKSDLENMLFENKALLIISEIVKSRVERYDIQSVSSYEKLKK